jgi:hypothetical protein
MPPGSWSIAKALLSISVKTFSFAGHSPVIRAALKAKMALETHTRHGARLSEYEEQFEKFRR